MFNDITKLSFQEFISDMIDFVERVSILSHSVKRIEIKLVSREDEHFTFIKDFKKS